MGKVIPILNRDTDTFEDLEVDDEVYFRIKEAEMENNWRRYVVTQNKESRDHVEET